MSRSTSIFRFFAAALMVVTLSTLALADTIRLKDGSLIKGTIVSFSNGKFTVVIGTGSRTRELTFLDSEVASITFDKVAEVTTQTASYTPEQPRVVEPPRVITNTPKTTPATPKEQPKNSVKAKPIELSVRVLADNTANGWTNTGFVVRKGQRVHISGDGKVSLGKGQTSTASGEPDIADNNKLLKNVATGALIAVIGDDNNDFIYIGSTREFTATRDGALFLGINEGNLDDNSGALTAKVEIFPDIAN